jgi:hypothetical protein
MLRLDRELIFSFQLQPARTAGLVNNQGITSTCGLAHNSDVMSPLGVDAVVNTAVPVALCVVAPGPPAVLSPYVTIICPVTAASPSTVIFMSMPMTISEVTVPPVTSTVKNPALEVTMLGGLHPAGTEILKVPYPGPDAHAVGPAV